MDGGIFGHKSQLGPRVTRNTTTTRRGYLTEPQYPDCKFATSKESTDSPPKHLSLEQMTTINYPDFHFECAKQTVLPTRLRSLRLLEQVRDCVSSAGCASVRQACVESPLAQGKE